MYRTLKFAGILSCCAALGVSIAFVAESAAGSGPDRYAVKVPGGMAFAEFKGYEGWQLISLSHGDKLIAGILGNPTMIEALATGIPANGKPFPDGAKMAKVHWVPKISEKGPGPVTVPGELHDVDFMQKDGKRFAGSGGWGYAAFEYDAATDTFRPGGASDHPPQAHDAKCGFACHTRVQARDYVFTEYAKR